MSHDSPQEKGEEITPAAEWSSSSADAVKLEDAEDAFEVFKKGDGSVDFRTVSWVHASVIFLKGKSLETTDPAVWCISLTTFQSSSPRVS